MSRMLSSARAGFLLGALFLTGTAVSAQEPPAVSVPHSPNVACPIMGKKISTKLYAETEFGRIYICCKSCIEDIMADVATAYATAYPVNRKLANEVCLISGKPIEKDSPTVKLQGLEISIHSADLAAVARANAQALLARIADPKVVDLGNRTCPVTGKAVSPDTFVLIDKLLVRVTTLKDLETIKKDPAAILKKARALRAEELAQEAAAAVEAAAAAEQPR